MKDKLYNFIVNNHNLEILESKINQFNPFNILKIENHEIRHSNVISWLLNPKGNHNIGDLFLKKVISQIILQNENVVDDNLNILDIHLGDFGDSIVEREKANIDILISSEKNNIVILFENKIYAKESKEQLTKYLDFVKNSYKGFKILPVFLTLDGDEPKYNSNYTIFSYESVYKLIIESLDLKRNMLPSDVIEFINFYLKVLERALDMNEPIKNLCQKIYSEHKEAIDLIVETMNNNESSIKPQFENFIKNHNELAKFSLTSRKLWFLPKRLQEHLPKVNNNWEIPYYIGFWFYLQSDNNINFHLEIGPFNKGEDRLKFINFLESEGYKISKIAKRLESKYTRLYNKKVKISDITDEEKVLDIIENIYSQSSKEINLLINTVEKYTF